MNIMMYYYFLRDSFEDQGIAQGMSVERCCALMSVAVSNRIDGLQDKDCQVLRFEIDWLLLLLFLFFFFVWFLFWLR